MKNTINISLDDVKDFLFIQGYVWNGAIIFNNKRTYASEFKQLGKERSDLTALKLHNSEKSFFKSVAIDETTFTLYNETIGSDIDDTFDYELDKDLSEQWVKFLVQRYGNTYRKQVKDLCKQMREKEIKTNRASLEKIRLIKLDIIRRLKHNLNHYSDIEKWLDETNEFKK